MAKKLDKNTLISILTDLPYSDHHNHDKAALEGMNTGALRELHKNLQDKMAQEALANEPKTEPAPGPAPVPATSTPVDVKFISLCGAPFDPDPNGTCFKVCQKDEPSAFGNCKNHFETLPAKSAVRQLVKKSKTRDTDHWGKRPYDQTWLLNSLLLDGMLVHPDGASEVVGVSTYRVRHHYKHLVNDKGEKHLFITPAGDYFLDIFDNPELTGAYGAE